MTDVIDLKVRQAARLERLGVRARDIRAWAEATGVPCPSRGVIPRMVVDLYVVSHRGTPDGAA